MNIIHMRVGRLDDCSRSASPLPACQHLYKDTGTDSALPTMYMTKQHTLYNRGV